MKKIVLGNADYIVGIEQTEPVEGRATGFPMITFRKVGEVGAKVGDVVGLPMAQIEELTIQEESFGIIFQQDDSAAVVAGILDVIANGSVNTATEL
jgi:hypothetical protein